MKKISFVMLGVVLFNFAFSEDYSEKTFLYRVLENAYQTKIISNSVLSSYQTEIKSGSMYNPELFVKGNYTGATNSEDEQLSRLENYSVSAGIKKMFETRTIVSLEAGETYSGTTVKTFDFDLSSYPPSFNSIYSNTQLAKPFVKISVIQPILKDGLWDFSGFLFLDLNHNIQKLSELGARIGFEGMVYATLIQYHKFLTDLELLSINQESLNDSRALLEKYKARAKLGAVDQADLNRFEAQLIQLDLSLRRSRQLLDNDLENIRLALRTNIILDDIRVIDSMVLETNNYDYETVIKEAKLNKADLLQAKVISDNAGINFRLAKSSAMPDLNLTASYTLRGAGQEFGFYSLDYHDLFLGLELKMPILTPTERAKILEAEYQKKNAELDLSYQEEKLELDLKASLNALSLRKDFLDGYQRLIELNIKLDNQAKKDYENGKISSRDLLQAAEDLRRAKILKVSENLQNKLAFLNLELQKGSLLKSYGITVFEKQGAK